MGKGCSATAKMLPWLFATTAPPGTNRTITPCLHEKLLVRRSAAKQARQGAGRRQMSRVLPRGCICRHEPSSPAPGKEATPGWLWVRVLLAYQTRGQGTQGHQKMGQQPIQPPRAFTEALKPSPSSLNRDSCSPMSPTTRTDGGFLPNW